MAALTWEGRADEDPRLLLTGQGDFQYTGYRPERLPALVDLVRVAPTPGGAPRLCSRSSRTCWPPTGRRSSSIGTTCRCWFRSACTVCWPSWIASTSARSGWIREPRAPALRRVRHLPGGHPGPGPARPARGRQATGGGGDAAERRGQAALPTGAAGARRARSTAPRSRRIRICSGAALNVACSFSRQGRYEEAADEAAKLIRRAYVPWNREVARSGRPGDPARPPGGVREGPGRAPGSSGGLGRASARKGVLFVARTKPPVSVDRGGGAGARPQPGDLLLDPGDRAFLPGHGRGRPRARLRRFLDGGRVAYLLAGKLVRSPGQPDRLRGLALRVLELSTMTLGPVVPLPADVARAELWFAAQPRLRLRDEAGRTSAWALGPDGLVASRDGARPRLGEAVVLAGRGGEPTLPQIRRGQVRLLVAHAKSRRRHLAD